MLKRDWSNGFASGLIVAICAIALLFITIGAVENSGTRPPKQSTQCDASDQQCPQKNDGGGYWWGVTKSLVSSEDTLAQWLMMVASLLAVGISGLAVYWVKRTFEITRDMAKDTREMGQMQVRAYLSSTTIDSMLGWNAESKLHSIRLTPVILNTGQSPALITGLYSAHQFIPFGQSPRVEFSSIDANVNHALGSGGAFSMAEQIIMVEEASNAWVGKQRCFLLGWASYKTVFDSDGPDQVVKFCYEVQFRMDPLVITQESGNALIKLHSQTEFNIGPKNRSADDNDNHV